MDRFVGVTTFVGRAYTCGRAYVCRQGTKESSGDKYNIKWPLVVIYLVGAICTLTIPLVGHLGHLYV
uniref:Uncharacterized protein n=1 Tax=Romanomermis culicivorax TaxID=13658 RepID=A0A915HV54_ROMCU